MASMSTRSDHLDEAKQPDDEDESEFGWVNALLYWGAKRARTQVVLQQCDEAIEICKRRIMLEAGAHV
jgi:hypothetical protein